MTAQVYERVNIPDKAPLPYLHKQYSDATDTLYMDGLLYPENRVRRHQQKEYNDFIHLKKYYHYVQFLKYVAK